MCSRDSWEEMGHRNRKQDIGKEGVALTLGSGLKHLAWREGPALGLKGEAGKPVLRVNGSRA